MNEFDLVRQIFLSLEKMNFFSKMANRNKKLSSSEISCMKYQNYIFRYFMIPMFHTTPGRVLQCVRKPIDGMQVSSPKGC